MSPYISEILQYSEVNLHLLAAQSCLLMLILQISQSSTGIM